MISYLSELICLFFMYCNRLTDFGLAIVKQESLSTATNIKSVTEKGAGTMVNHYTTIDKCVLSIITYTCTFIQAWMAPELFSRKPAYSNASVSVPFSRFFSFHLLSIYMYE